MNRKKLGQKDWRTDSGQHTDMSKKERKREKKEGERRKKEQKCIFITILQAL